MGAQRWCKAGCREGPARPRYRPRRRITSPTPPPPVSVSLPSEGGDAVDAPKHGMRCLRENRVTAQRGTKKKKKKPSRLLHCPPRTLASSQSRKANLETLHSVEMKAQPSLVPSSERAGGDKEMLRCAWVGPPCSLCEPGPVMGFSAIALFP